MFFWSTYRSNFLCRQPAWVAFQNIWKRCVIFGLSVNQTTFVTVFRSFIRNWSWWGRVIYKHWVWWSKYYSFIKYLFYVYIFWGKKVLWSLKVYQFSDHKCPAQIVGSGGQNPVTLNLYTFLIKNNLQSTLHTSEKC